jgi:hypothetical protein
MLPQMFWDLFTPDLLCHKIIELSPKSVASTIFYTILLTNFVEFLHMSSCSFSKNAGTYRGGFIKTPVDFDCVKVFQKP